MSIAIKADATPYLRYLAKIGVVNPKVSVKRKPKDEDVFCFSFAKPNITLRNLTQTCGKPRKERAAYGGIVCDSHVFTVAGHGTIHISFGLLEGNMLNGGPKQRTTEQLLQAIERFEMDPGDGYANTYSVAPAVRAALAGNLTIRQVAVLVMSNNYGGVVSNYSRQAGARSHPEVVAMLKDAVAKARAVAKQMYAKESADLQADAAAVLNSLTDADIEKEVEAYRARNPKFDEDDISFKRNELKRDVSTTKPNFDQIYHTLSKFVPYPVWKTFGDRVDALQFLSRALKLNRY